MCSCDKAEETVQHLLLDCELHEVERDHLERAVREATGQPQLTTELLLADRQEDMTKGTHLVITTALNTFLEATGRFSKRLSALSDMSSQTN